MINAKIAILTFLLSILTYTAVAAPTQSDYSQGILDLEQVLQSSIQVTTEVYPNADVVQVDEFILTQYEPNGTGAEWVDNYEKVLTEKGKRQKQSLSYAFTLPYNRVTVTLLEVIKPDGTVVPVDIEKQSRVMIDRSQMSVNIYNPNDKILRVGVPGLEIGDMVHQVSLYEIVKTRMPDAWGDYQVFESTTPIKHGIYEVHAPKQRPLCSIALKDAVEGTITSSTFERDDRVIHRWEISDVSRIYTEPDMPPYYTVVQRLLISTLGDWKEISSWYWQLCEPHLKTTTEKMAQTVAKLIEGNTDRQSKIEAIFRWVSQEVRYMGITIEAEAPGYEPHDVSLTFENRHGVCRDKAALLAAMLRLADIEAYPVIIHVGPKKDEEVPGLYFNHAICCVRNDDNTYLLMDPTDENTKELLPAYLCDRSYLVAYPEGESLQTSPIIPANENMVLVETSGQIDSQGNLTAETELKFNGINDNAYRGYFARVKPEQRRRFFEGMIKNVVAGASLTDLELRPADMQDTSEALSVHMKYQAKDILVGDGNMVMLPVPNMGTRVGMVNFIIGKTGLTKRRFPLKTDYACGVREKMDIQLDSSVGRFVSLPDFEPIEDETVSWKRTLNHQEKILQGQSEFLINVVEFSPEQYLQLKESLKQIEYNGRKMPILSREKSSDSSDADMIILDHLIEYDLNDVHNWTEKHHVKKKILTYKGKKDNAELKLNYNPIWEEVNLLNAMVTNAEQVKEISKEEINLMDAGWVASAPRYPAAKTLVASLPGVEIGSVIEYEYERIKKDRPFFADSQIFASFDPIDKKIVRLTAPASLRLQIVRDDNGVAVLDRKQSDDITPVIAQSELRQGNEVVFEWKVSDRPAVKREDYLPPLYSFNPVLRITTGDWKSYAKDIRSILLKAAAEQTAAQARAKEIVRDKNNDSEKVIAIRDFVAKSIRAAGPGLDQLPLDSVTPADQTLADGYGNITDRAVLLYAMLKAVELEPKFILAADSSPVAELQQFEAQYPLRGLFSTVLVKVRCGSEDVYLNDTNQYAQLGVTPSDGYLSLDIIDGQTGTISVMQDKENLVNYEYKISLTAQGDAHMDITTKRYGGLFTANHKMFAEMPPEERNRYYQELVAEIAQSATADSELVTNYDSYPGGESYSVQIERYAVRDGDFLYFKLPKSLSNLFGLRSDTHENPFYYSWNSRLRISTIIELPSEFSKIVLAPQQKMWMLPASMGQVQVTISTDYDTEAESESPKLTLIHSVELNPSILEAESYPDLLEINRQLTHIQAGTVLLRRQ